MMIASAIAATVREIHVHCFSAGWDGMLLSKSVNGPPSLVLMERPAPIPLRQRPDRSATRQEVPRRSGTHRISA